MNVKHSRGSISALTCEVTESPIQAFIFSELQLLHL